MAGAADPPNSLRINSSNPSPHCLPYYAKRHHYIPFAIDVTHVDVGQTLFLWSERVIGWNNAGQANVHCLFGLGTVCAEFKWMANWHRGECGARSLALEIYRLMYYRGNVRHMSHMCLNTQRDLAPNPTRSGALIIRLNLFNLQMYDFNVACTFQFLYKMHWWYSKNNVCSFYLRYYTLLLINVCYPAWSNNLIEATTKIKVL